MNVSRHKLVMGVIPNSRGLAYTLFEDPLAPVDWGVAELRGKNRNRRCVGRVAHLLSRYQPDILVLQDMSVDGAHRVRRICRLNRAVALLAETHDVSVVAYSREQIRACFAVEGVATKQRISEAIAKRISLFEPLLPPPRKLWNSEHPRMGLFDAAALVLAFYYLTSNRSPQNLAHAPIDGI